MQGLIAAGFAAQKDKIESLQKLNKKLQSELNCLRKRNADCNRIQKDSINKIETLLTKLVFDGENANTLHIEDINKALEKLKLLAE